MRSTPNIALLAHVARRLQELREQVVFVGGAIVDLLLTDVAAGEVRATADVDFIVEMTSKYDYSLLTKRLRALGFQEDTSEGAPICRFRVDGAIVDAMPSDPSILGFSNRWYADVLTHAEAREIDRGLVVRVASAPFFVATKLEALKGRSRGDFIGSRDLEDIVAVFDGRAELVEEILKSPISLFLSEQFESLLRNRSFVEALPAHLRSDPASQARLATIEERMKAVASRAR